MLNINQIKEVAEKAVTMSELMLEKEKVETRDIIKTYPNGITINDCDYVEPTDETQNGFYVYTFKEEPHKFAFSGFCLTKVFNNILKACEGDLTEMRESLHQGLKVRLEEGKTQDGKRQITKVYIL